MVRPCRMLDVAVLEQHFPTGRNHFHEARFRRQSAGFSTFLIGCLGDVPVGSAEILWQGAKEPDVRDRFPGCPEINGLDVAPERRSQGIGTTVIRAAERLASGRGYHRIGLGVDQANLRAAALYLRLGYVDTGFTYVDHYQVVDNRGVRHEVADPCRFLVKDPC